jgi:diguanylate cyclase (GGDEF)-like protein/PAS domain S-box-containing protein
VHAVFPAGNWGTRKTGDCGRMKRLRFCGTSAAFWNATIPFVAILAAVTVWGLAVERVRYHYTVAALSSIFIAGCACGVLIVLSRQRRNRRELELKNTVLKTEQEASPDAIFLVNEDGKIVSYNHQLVELWNIPEELVRAGDDEQALRIVVEKLQDPQAFLAKVQYLYAHREEKSSDELLMKDGRILERYSAPVIGPHNDYYGRIWHFRDVTERKRAEGAAREQELQRQAILDNIPDIAWLKDTNSRFLACNVAFARSCGQLPSEVLGKTDFDLFPREIAQHYRDDDAEVMRTGTHKSIEEALVLPNGTSRVIETIKTCVCDAAGIVTGTAGIARDITERRRAEEQLRLSAKAFEGIADGIIITDARRKIVSVNKAFVDITGYQLEEVLNRRPRILQSGRHDAAFYSDMWREINETGHWRGEIWDRRKSGEIYPELLRINAVKDESGSVTHYIGACTDITSLKRYEARLLYQASYDALTGLANRTLFQERFREGITRSRRHDHEAAVLFLDIDHFKNVNDSLGHEAGDLLLQTVAQRLTANIREVDTLARFGGDEFAVLLDTINDNQTAAIVAQNLLDAVAKPFQLRGHEFYVSISIGISCYPQDGADIDLLLKNADTAMYRAKSEGRNNFQFFSPDMNAKALENLVMTNGLRLGLARQEFLLHYQPCYDLKTGQITSTEALVRWNHPTLGLIPPSTFIPLAEESGLIELLGEFVLRSACRQMREWKDADFPIQRVAVNLSARQFRHPGLVQRITSALEDAGLPGHCLELEVTESMVMHDSDASIAFRLIS